MRADRRDGDPVRNGADVKPKRRLQCAKCPWRKNVDPNDIPGQYCVKKHEDLRNTIARPGEMRITGGLRMMACHETPIGAEKPCVGWLEHQLGVGNNIGLRLLLFQGRIEPFATVGPQHERFEDTLPKKRKKKR